MRNKVVAMVLSMVMAVSILTGCGSDKDTPTVSESVSKQPTQGEASAPQASSDASVSEPEEIAEDHFAGTTLEIVVVKKANDTCTDWNEKEIFQMAEEATGIHVDWTLIDPSVSKDKIAVMLMSDDQPDAYIGALDETTLSANLDLFYDLSEEGLLETWAPKIVEDYNSVDGAWDSIKWQDGSIRSLLTGGMQSSVGDWIASALAINSEWLDKIGKDVPATAEELYEVLVAFRDGDMNGNGDPDDEIPMSFCSGFWQADFMNLANAFGIGGNRSEAPQDAYKNIKDGKVVSTVDTDNYRAFLEFHHKLYSEGLLDIEGFSQTSEQYQAKWKENTVGVMLAYTSPMGEGFVPFIYQGIDGVDPLITGLAGAFIAQRTSFCISADSENVEAVLHWWNWLSKDEETKLNAYFGPGYYEMIDGEYYQKADLPEEYNYATEGMHNFAPALLPGEGAPAHPSTLPARSIARTEFIEANQHLINQEGFPVAFGNPEAAEEKAFIEAELFPYISTFSANAVVNGVTDASWEQHLEDLKVVQYYEWLQWYQDLVDEVASR